MSFQDEEEGPCMHHRSLFDTIPAPPSFAARKPSEPTLMSARGDFTGKGDDGEPVRVSANGRAAFAFPGGVTEVRKPTREELLLSAKQWVTSIKEELQDNGAFDTSLDGRMPISPGGVENVMCRFERLDAVLKELADATE